MARGGNRRETVWASQGDDPPNAVHLLQEFICRSQEPAFRQSAWALQQGERPAPVRRQTGGGVLGGQSERNSSKGQTAGIVTVSKLCKMIPTQHAR